MLLRPTVARHPSSHYALYHFAPLGIPSLIFEPRRHPECLTFKRDQGEPSQKTPSDYLSEVPAGIGGRGFAALYSTNAIPHCVPTLSAFAFGTNACCLKL